MVRSDIVVKGLTKRFGSIAALSNISMDSDNGINVVLGPNGAGKSTLLKCIAGLYRPDVGGVSVLGSDPYSHADARARISLLADYYGLYDFMSVEDNMRFFGRFYGLRGSEAVARVRELIDGLELKQYMRSRVETLSRGTKQKVAFCRSMLNDSQVLLLDEPTAFLDADSSETIRGRVRDAAKDGKTVMFVTQRLDEVTKFNARILVLRHGRVVRDTDTDGIYTAIFRNADIRIRLARPLGEKALRRLRGTVSVQAGDPAVLRIHVRGYKEVNKMVERLIAEGAFIVGVDYIEPAIEGLVFGDKR